MKLAAALLVLAACGDNIDDPAEPHSGARIKVVRYTFDDGTAQLEREFFFDVELGAQCYVQQWSDGAHYCTPTFSEAVFVDRTCSNAIGVALANDSPSYFATYYGLRNTALPSALYRAGDWTVTPRETYRMQDGVCLGPFTDDNPQHRYFTVGARVSMENTRLKHSTPSATTRLADIFATSDDGLRLAIDVYDNELELQCKLDGRGNVPAAACAPAVTDAYISYFTDAQCTQPVMPVVTASPPSIARRDRPGTSCIDYYRVTGPVGVPALYQRLGDACIVEPISNAPQYYGVEPLELATVPRTSVGMRRLQPIAFGDLATADRVLHDTQLGTDCERMVMSSGEIRCLPTSSATVETVFSDDTCKTSVQIALVSDHECTAPSSFARAEDVHAIQGVFTGPLYELTTGDRCGLYPVPAGFVAHSLGPALPIESFAAATMTFDP